MAKELLAQTKRKLDDVALRTLPAVLTALGELGRGRTGGFVRIFLAVDASLGMKGWQELYFSRVGSQHHRDDWEKYRLISMEKALRLMKRHMMEGHISSWQSRADAFQAYGGAFILETFIRELGGEVRILISFSGLPEKADEAYGMMLAQNMEWPFPITRLQEIVVVSQNELAERLYVPF